MKKVTVLVLTMLISAIQAFGQESRFSLDLATDLSIGAAVLALNGVSYLADPVISDQTDISAINSFDRSLMFEIDGTMDDISTYGAYASLLVPASIFLHLDFEMDNLLTYGVMYSEAFLLANGTKEILKTFISRYRPYTYFGDISLDPDADDYYNSFPSGHTTFAFMSSAFLTTTLLLEKAPASLSIPIISASYLLSGTVAVLRITSGAHFPTDVLVGAGIGSLAGWLVPFLHYNGELETDEGSGLLAYNPSQGLTVGWKINF